MTCQGPLDRGTGHGHSVGHTAASGTAGDGRVSTAGAVPVSAATV